MGGSQIKVQPTLLVFITTQKRVASYACMKYQESGNMLQTVGSSVSPIFTPASMTALAVLEEGNKVSCSERKVKSL